ncbi:MAG: diacylglycerol kinase family protein [Pirellulaceae bacterium]|nr:diacylglycerol kinase family protein [Pirellulaceae bacterium]
MTSDSEPTRRGWIAKFGFAFRGLAFAIRTQNSFWVHLPITICVVVLASILQVGTWQWVALTLATAMVFATELLNTAIEQLVKVLHPDHDPRIGHALDMAAAGVLATSIGAVIVGVIVLGPPLAALF